MADGASEPDLNGGGTARGADAGRGETSDEVTTGRPGETAGAGAPRRDRFFAAASARGIPLATILAVDAVVIATWVGYRVLGRLRDVILWVLIAVFVSVVLDPLVVSLERRGLRRGGAVVLVFLGAIVAFLALLGLFGYPLVNSLTHVAEELPKEVNQVQKGHGWLAHELQRLGLLHWVQRNAPKLKTFAHSLGKPALTVGKNVGKAVFSTVLTLSTIAFLSLFMLLEAPRLRRGFLGTLSPDHRKEVEDIAHQVSRQVSGYVLGTMALGLMFGVVIFVTMLILGVPFALLIGLWVALVALIPLVGGIIAGIPTVALAFLHSPTAGIVTAIVFIGFQLIENHFIYPLVMSKSVSMNPLWVLLAVLVGANLGGIFGSSLGALAGALVAIPVGSAIQVIFREVWARTRASPVPDDAVAAVLVEGSEPDGSGAGAEERGATTAADAPAPTAEEGSRLR